MLSETGTFTHGITVAGQTFRDFVLAEEVMRHTFLVSNDATLDLARLAGDEKKGIPADAAYYSACLLAARLTVQGLDKVTPEQVENLSREDGNLLLVLGAKIEIRRDLLRAQAQPAAQGYPGDEKAGLPDGGNPGDEQGHDQVV